MIICSCSGVTDRDIRQAIARMAVPAELRGLRHRSAGHAPAKPGDHDPIAEEAGHNSLPAFAS